MNKPETGSKDDAIFDAEDTEYNNICNWDEITESKSIETNEIPPDAKQTKNEIKCWICNQCKTVNNLSLTLRKYKMQCCLPCCYNQYDPQSMEIISSIEWNLCPHKVPLEYKLCHLCYNDTAIQELQIRRSGTAFSQNDYTLFIRNRSRPAHDRELRLELLIDGYIHSVIHNIHMFPFGIINIIIIYFDPFKFGRQKQNSLQGRVYEGMDIITGKRCVIKETWRQLVETERTRHGSAIPFTDWLSEREFVLSLSKLPDRPLAIIKGIQGWDDEHCYYYATEFWDTDFFEFIQKKHSSEAFKLNLQNCETKEQKTALYASQWLKDCAEMFKQICNTTQWIHNKEYCHLDLSLEVLAISIENMQLKIVDFDLMKRFEDTFSNHRCGKLGYMAPEVYAGQDFDGRLADVWSLGVVLFMMLIGAPPYGKPVTTNPAFNFIIHGRLKSVLKHWKRLSLITEDALDLLCKIFKYENHRISLSEILKHPFLTMVIQ